VSAISFVCPRSYLGLVVQNSDTPVCPRSDFRYGCWQQRGEQQRWTNCSRWHSLNLMWS